MKKTFVINYCKQVNLNEVALFADGLHAAGNYSFHNADFGEKSLQQITGYIEQELSMRKNYNWQVIFIVPALDQSCINKQIPMSAYLVYVSDIVMPKIKFKPKNIFYIGICTEPVKNSVHPIDAHGNYLPDNKFVELGKAIENTWDNVARFDKSNIRTHEGFDGIDNPEFKNHVSEALLKMKADFKKFCIEGFNPEQFLLTGTKTIDLETITKIEQQFSEYLEEVKDNPNRYNSYVPKIELQNIFRSMIGLRSKKCMNFKGFYFDYSKTDNPIEELKTNFRLQLVLLIITEHNHLFNVVEPIQEIDVELDEENLNTGLSMVVFSLRNAARDLATKLSDNSAEFRLETNTFAPNNTDSYNPKAFTCSVGLLNGQNNIGKWQEFKNVVTEDLKKHKQKIDTDIENLYCEMNSSKNSVINQHEDNIFAFENTKRRELENMSQSVYFPEFGNLSNDWNNFISEKDKNIRELIKFQPYLNSVLLTAIAGFLILAIVNLFSSNSASIHFTWLAVFALVVFIISLIALLTLVKPVKEIIGEVNTNYVSYIGKYNQTKHDYSTYLQKIQQLKILRKNYSAIKTESQNKNRLFRKCKYHQEELHKTEKKIEKFMSSYGINLDTNFSTVLGGTLHVEKPRGENPIYTVSSDIYKSNQSTAHEFIMANKTERSSLGMFVKNITLRIIDA
jgi:hypothetical protein